MADSSGSVVSAHDVSVDVVSPVDVREQELHFRTQVLSEAFDPVFPLAPPSPSTALTDARFSRRRSPKALHEHRDVSAGCAHEPGTAADTAADAALFGKPQIVPLSEVTKRRLLRSLAWDCVASAFAIQMSKRLETAGGRPVPLVTEDGRVDVTRVRVVFANRGVFVNTLAVASVDVFEGCRTLKDVSTLATNYPKVSMLFPLIPNAANIVRTIKSVHDKEAVEARKSEEARARKEATTKGSKKARRKAVEAEEAKGASGRDPEAGSSEAKWGEVRNVAIDVPAMVVEVHVTRDIGASGVLTLVPPSLDDPRCIAFRRGAATDTDVFTNDLVVCSDAAPVLARCNDFMKETSDAVFETIGAGLDMVDQSLWSFATPPAKDLYRHISAFRLAVVAQALESFST